MISPLFGSYWPWWLGALALGCLAVGHWLLTGRLLGVSGVFLRLMKLPGELRAASAERAAAVGAAELAAALEAETLVELTAQLGPEGAKAFLAQAEQSAPADACALEPAPSRSPWTADLVFVLAVVAGGALSAATSEGLHLRPGLDADLSRLWGDGFGGWAALLVGGALAGFGTCLCGGCTSGHGLSGCSRLQPGSLLATASFFGTGVAASIAFARWLA